MSGTKEILDPRIRRTRLLLQQALEKLLAEQEFEKISVQDIAEAATINRVTFYDHYTDKFALLECMVGSRFHELIAKRNVQYDAGCSNALGGIIEAVCDYLDAIPRLENDQQRLIKPHMEAAIISVVRRMLLDGFERHHKNDPVPPQVQVEMLATTVSWAIYGGAQEWVRTTERLPKDEVVKTILSMIEPIFTVLNSH
ncbi:MAG TPA: TetR/AcrR family transcriptional regulator [Oculatellaceae cyanobacterium]